MSESSILGTFGALPMPPPDQHRAMVHRTFAMLERSARACREKIEAGSTIYDAAVALNLAMGHPERVARELAAMWMTAHGFVDPVTTPATPGAVQ